MSHFKFCVFVTKLEESVFTAWTEKEKVDFASSQRNVVIECFREEIKLSRVLLEAQLDILISGQVLENACKLDQLVRNIIIQTSREFSKFIALLLQRGYNGRKKFTKAEKDQCGSCLNAFVATGVHKHGKYRHSFLSRSVVSGPLKCSCSNIYYKCMKYSNN